MQNLTLVNLHVQGATGTAKANDILAIWITSDQETYTLSLTDNGSTYSFAVNTVPMIKGTEVVNTVKVTVTKNVAFTDQNTVTLTCNTSQVSNATSVTVKESNGITINGSGVTSVTFTVEIKGVNANVVMTLADEQITDQA